MYIGGLDGADTMFAYVTLFLTTFSVAMGSLFILNLYCVDELKLTLLERS
jgi:hypothetical protein